MKKIWILETCKSDAKRYKSRSEWQKFSVSAYQAARRNGWLDECCEHMEKRSRWVYYYQKQIRDSCGGSFEKWKKVYWPQFRHAEEIGILAWLEDGFEMCIKYPGSRKPTGFWTKERCFEDAKRFKNRTQWRDNSQFAYRKSIELGWIDEFFPKN